MQCHGVAGMPGLEGRRAEQSGLCHQGNAQHGTVAGAARRRSTRGANQKINASASSVPASETPKSATITLGGTL